MQSLISSSLFSYSTHRSSFDFSLLATRLLNSITKEQHMTLLMMSLNLVLILLYEG